jgi:hypothetical protein
MKIIYLLLVLVISSTSGTEYNENEVYLIDDFNKDLHLEWQGRNKNYSNVYSIFQEEDNSYLKARSEYSDHLILKKIEVNLVEYPYLNWRWRGHILPVQGDESVKKILRCSSIDRTCYQ